MPIRYCKPCTVCGRPYLQGSGGTCQSCMRDANSSAPKYHKPAHLRCDCGNWAVVVILVRVGNMEDGFSEERLPLCEQCLEVEKQTQVLLDCLGYG